MNYWLVTWRQNWPGQGDPGGFPPIRLVRGKVAAFNHQLRAIAEKHECLHADLWSMRVLADSREWCADRLHLAPTDIDGLRCARARKSGVPSAKTGGSRCLARSASEPDR